MFPFFLAFLITFSGCEFLNSFLEKEKDPEPDRQSIEQADESLKDNDLPSAMSKYETALSEHPKDVDAATGGAYVAMLKGDLEKADQLLAAVQAEAGDKKGDVLLRRAIIAIRAQKFEEAKKYALDSGKDMGKLFAAEIALVDDENDEAKELLESIEDSQVKVLANKYLQFMNKDDMSYHLISASQAMWALGDYKVAVRSIAKPLETAAFEGKAEEQLLWAGRAVVLGEITIAKKLLPKASSIEDDKQKWRVSATNAMILCAENKVKKCLKVFANLEGKAPKQGLIDAKITAANLIVDAQPAVAKELVKGYESNAAAHVLFRAGDTDGAKKAAKSGIYSTYLNEGG